MASILIVDDRVSNREFLVTLLGYHGHRMLEASDGAEALGVARRERPEVVITDILMPTMDGYEFVRQLREIPELARTVVIFCTAHYHGTEAEKLAADCGVSHILTKPCEPELVLSTLEQVLSKKAEAASAPSGEFDRAHLQLVTDKLSQESRRFNRSNERLAALIDINLQLASERDRGRLLENVCHAARELFGAKYALLAVGTDERADFIKTSGMDAATSAGLGTVELGRGAVGDVLKTQKARRVANPDGHAAAVGLPAGHPPVQSLLVAPIVSLSQIYGWIALTDKVGADGFNAEDERLLAILGGQVGRTYENGSLVKELQASEQRYRTIFESSVLGIFAIDTSERVVSANAALRRMLGYEPGDARLADTAAVAREIYVEPDAQTRFRGLLASQNTVENFETRWRRKDGTIIWVSLSARRVDHPDGGDISHIGLVEDITERVLLGDALREREAGLRHAQEMAGLAHVITAPDGAFVAWSETLPKLAGVDVEKLPRSTRDWLRILHADDRAMFRQKAIDAGVSYMRCNVEYRLVRPDGTPIHVRQTMEPLGARDASGKSRWFNTLQDVSDQKRAEDRIKRLNRVYAVLSAINSAIVRLRDRRELFNEACRIAVVEGAFTMALVAEIDSTTQDGSVVSCYGGPKDYADEVRFNARDDSPEADWPVCRVAREMKPVICNDTRTDVALAPIRERLLRGGFHSLALFPLVVGGRTEAVLALYSRDADFFDDAEVQLLNELAGDVSFSLEHIAREAKLDYLAYYDALTGLPNSTLFRDRLVQFIEVAAHEGHQIALYLIDLDHFTDVNDTLGRHAGDALLKMVAERFSDALQKPSSLARISGDTFAVAVADLRHGAIESVAVLDRQLFASLAQGFTVDGQPLRVSARAGIALYPGDGKDSDILFKNAEVALQRAKASDERHLFYAPEMNARMAERLTLEQQLRTALEARQFVLHYQPIVELSGGQIVGAEALIRWQHPDLGLLPPERFLAVAEENDIIIDIGDWTLRTACAEAKSWNDAGGAALTVAVNLSARQFRDDALVRRIADALAATGLAPGLLELELTENIVMENAELFIAKLHELKALGVKLVLDDFGTGYSSLSYLKRFPLDQLKVDQSFIRDVITNPDDAAIVRAVLSIGHSLGLELVAEGVETALQLAWLRRHRCEKVQGFHLSRPVAAEAFLQLVRDRTPLAGPSEIDDGRRRTLLVVDDEANIIASVVRLLRREDYRILTANSAAEALELLAANAVHVIVSDHRMPVMTGAEFLGKVKSLYPDTVRILFSGHVELDALTDAVNRGAVYRFLIKPWDDEALRGSIRDAFRYYWLTHRERAALEGGDAVEESGPAA